jgi:hypothetical protein
MKKIIVSSLILLSLPIASLAVENSGISSSTQTRSDLQKLIQMKRDELRNQKVAIKEMVADRRSQIIEHRFDKMIDRYQATIDREKIILNKINSRITKIKNLGVDTSTAENMALTAKTNIDSAQTSLETLKSWTANEIIQELSSTTPKTLGETMSKMRKALAEIEKNLKDAKKTMEKITGTLRGSSELHATTTSNN